MVGPLLAGNQLLHPRSHVLLAGGAIDAVDVDVDVEFAAFVLGEVVVGFDARGDGGGLWRVDPLSIWLDKKTIDGSPRAAAKVSSTMDASAACRSAPTLKAGLANGMTGRLGGLSVALRILPQLQLPQPRDAIVFNRLCRLDHSHQHVPRDGPLVHQSPCVAADHFLCEPLPPSSSLFHLCFWHFYLFSCSGLGSLRFSSSSSLSVVRTAMGITVNEAGRRRWRGVGKEARTKLAGAAAGSYWAKLTREERSAEMKRRAKVRERNRRRKKS
jgi:hypothetical protein